MAVAKPGLGIGRHRVDAVVGESVCPADERPRRHGERDGLVAGASDPSGVAGRVRKDGEHRSRVAAGPKIEVMLQDVLVVHRGSEEPKAKDGRIKIDACGRVANDAGDVVDAGDVADVGRVRGHVVAPAPTAKAIPA